MLEELRLYFALNANYTWKMCGSNDYVQVMVEPGANIENQIILELCSKLECSSSVSCVHSDLMYGYCLMIEFYR